MGKHLRRCEIYPENYACLGTVHITVFAQNVRSKNQELNC